MRKNVVKSYVNKFDERMHAQYFYERFYRFNPMAPMRML